MLSACLLLGACGGEEITPPRASGETSAQRADGGAGVLRSLQTALARHDRSEAVRLAAPDAASRRTVSALYDNARALDLVSVRLRFVDDGAGDPPERLDRYGLGAWTGTVSVAWRLAGYDTGASQEDTRFSFVGVGSATRIAAVDAGDSNEADDETVRVPLWMAEPLEVVKGRDWLVMASPESGASPDRLAALAARAVDDVRRVLTSWRGRLVVEVPSDEDLLEQVLGAERGRYRAIAGVTTTVDGRQDRSAPVHVFLNPSVFDDLGPKGSQVVLSHETTHVATAAPFASMPTWLLEGFADYVALDHADVPLATAASQIFARIRRDGAPTALPSSDDLSPSAPGLGATYEEAWTVCRYIGLTYGEQRLITLYDRIDDGTAVGPAIRAVLGVSERTVVDGWSRDVTALAGATPSASGVPALPRGR